MAFLYGSAAAGMLKDESDIDVAILFDSVSGRDAFDLVSGLETELTIILKRDTEILVLDREKVRPLLFFNAVVHGIPVYFRDFTRLVDLKNEALGLKEDWELFGTSWQADLAAKKIEGWKHG